MKLNNLKKYIPIILLAMGSPLATQAQTTITTLAPASGELLRAARFGETTLFKNNMLLIADRQYRTDRQSIGCNIGHGALYIYKKNASNIWERSQKLKHTGGLTSTGTEVAENLTAAGQTNTSLKFNSVENGFGEAGFDVAGNLLVVSVPREDYNRLGPNYHPLAGAVYLFRRASATSGYTLLKKIYHTNPPSLNRYSDGGVSTNGEYIVAATQANNTISVFQLTESNVNIKSTIILPATWSEPYIHGTTENNIMVLSARVNGVNSVFLYRYENGTIKQYQTTQQTNVDGFEIQKEYVSVNGNYFVVKYQHKTTGKFLLKVFYVFANATLFDMNVLLPAEFDNLDIRGFSAWADRANALNIDSRSLAVSFKSKDGESSPIAPFTAYFKYKENLGVYTLKGNVQISSFEAQHSSYAYANRVLITDNEVILSDDHNSTFDSSNDGNNQQCSEYKSSGVVFVHGKSTFENATAMTPRNGNSEEAQASEEILAPNPATGNTIEYRASDKLMEVTATSVTGKTTVLKFSQQTIDTSSLEPGLYIFRLTTDSGMKSKKVQIN